MGEQQFPKHGIINNVNSKIFKHHRRTVQKKNKMDNRKSEAALERNTYNKDMLYCQVSLGDSCAFTDSDNSKGS